ncbi:MAG TPA: hypothetical protein VK469_01985 [Candidatus Kapabacteria bacterium]|nr:hypothetical protein [Candidatus Kapabacteria bacterium]
MSDYLVRILLYLLVTVPFCGIIFFIFYMKYKYSSWFCFDLLAIIIPIQIHSLLIEFNLLKSKGTGNEIGEPIYIGIVYVIVFLIRSVVGIKYPKKSKKYALGSFLIMLLIVLLLYLAVPFMNE